MLLNGKLILNVDRVIFIDSYDLGNEESIVTYYVICPFIIFTDDVIRQITYSLQSSLVFWLVNP